jgi:hypothetical protein
MVTPTFIAMESPQAPPKPTVALPMNAKGGG